MHPTRARRRSLRIRLVWNFMGTSLGSFRLPRTLGGGGVGTTPTYVRRTAGTTRFGSVRMRISTQFQRGSGRCHAGRGAPMPSPDTGPQEPFLSRLTADELAALRSRGVARRFDRGATIVHQGEVPGRVVLIESGHAKVCATTEDGKEVVLAFRGPGDIIGEAAAVSGGPRLATVRAL